MEISSEVETFEYGYCCALEFVFKILNIDYRQNAKKKGE